MFKTCARCHREFEGSNRSKYCAECKKETVREQKRKYQRRKRFEKRQQKPKIIKVSVAGKPQVESVMCHRIAAKLRHEGSYWDWLEGKHKLTREEVNHISRCESCQRLWSKLRSPRGLNLFHEKQEKAGDYQNEAQAIIRKEFEDLL